MMEQIDLHRELLRMRRGEQLLASLYRHQLMRTPTHFSIGQEAVSVGICAALDLPHDIVVTHHRSHAAYLACGGDFGALAAELYGRVTGCSKGRGGSVHLTARHFGFLASSAILGEMVAVATGCALAFKMNGGSQVATSFCGEATAEEGVLYEAWNYAALHKLPVLFVIENNGYSTESGLHTRQPRGTSLVRRAKEFGLRAYWEDGNDVMSVYETAKQIIPAVREGNPAVIEFETYRWLEHVGPNFDFESGRTYRSKDELEYWMRRCPIERSKRALIAAGYEEADLDAMDHDIQAELTDMALKEKMEPMPDPSTLLENVL